MRREDEENESGGEERRREERSNFILNLCLLVHHPIPPYPTPPFASPHPFVFPHPFVSPPSEGRRGHPVDAAGLPERRDQVRPHHGQETRHRRRVGSTTLHQDQTTPHYTTLHHTTLDYCRAYRLSDYAPVSLEQLPLVEVGAVKADDDE